MNTEAQQFLDALKEYSVDLSGPIGAAVGYFAGKRVQDARARKIRVDANATALQSLSRSFEALVEGYEQHVNEQAQEIEKLRAELWTLRAALDEKQNV